MLETCSALADAGRPICLGGTSAERGKTHRSVSKHYDNLTFCASEKIGDFRRLFDVSSHGSKKSGFGVVKRNNQ